MFEYYTLIEVLTYLFIAIMGRHAYYRGRFMIHMFQQSGYKLNEFGGWLRRHWSIYGISVPHAAFNLILLLLLLYLDNNLTSSAAIIIVTIFAVFWFGRVKAYVPEEVKKPLVVTPRVKRLSAILLLLFLPLPVYGVAWAYEAGYPFADIYILGFTWIIADLLIPLLMMIAAAFIQPVERSIQNSFIRQAQNKLASMPDLKTVAITGSYGKTSSKFILRRILEERFNVCATPGSYNTPMGICKVINNDLEAGHQILILEMGARYEGNIDELCQIARPDVAVLTNIGIAHLETFGSVDAIARTKGSLLKYLPEDGWAVLNADDKRVMNLHPGNKTKTLSAGLESGDLQAFDIFYDSNGCHFKVKDHQTGEEVEVQTPLLGAHNVQNIVQAMAVGKVFNLRLKTMAVALKAMKPVEHRMELKNRNGTIVIDDAFNSNPIGARNAVDVLSEFKGGRKFLITPGMIELGEREDEENQELGRYIGQKSLDKIYLVGRNQTAALRQGIAEAGFDSGKIEVVDSLFDANRRLDEESEAGDVVLYENDLPDSYNE